MALVVASGLLVAGLVGLVVFMILSDDDETVAPPTPTTPRPTPTTAEPTSPTASPSPTPTGLPEGVHPFTGRRDGDPGPVLAVKLDNVEPARPHTALAAADIVYVERVEAGLSRLLAIYSSRMPPVVGPVRSARENDIALLRQFGRPAFAFSGAQSKLLPLLARALFHDVSPAEAGSAYFRGSDRPAPHNLFARTRRLLAEAPNASRARDIGFRFGEAPPGGRPVERFTVRYPAFRLDLRWSSERRRWVPSMDGERLGSARGRRPEPATVVVQYVEIGGSRFRDSGGNVTPYSRTVGSGRAVVLRNGRAYPARWSRPRATDGTAFTRPNGEPMPFAPGQIWVVLAGR